VEATVPEQWCSVREEEQGVEREASCRLCLHLAGMRYGHGIQGGPCSTITYRDKQPPTLHATLTCHHLKVSCEGEQKDYVQPLEDALHEAKGIDFLELGSSQEME